MEYAWSQGCLVVCSAGNEQNDNPEESNIVYPAGYENSIAVAALERNGSLSSYSSWGPTVDRYMKPDLAAPAAFLDYPFSMGTSLASPWVAGSAAVLIDRCDSLGVSWTPGMLKASLLAGADPLPYSEYMVGVGRLNLESSIEIIGNAPLVDNIPFVIHATPTRIPLDLDPLYIGCPYDFYITICSSTNTEVFLTIDETSPSGIEFPTSLSIVNQSVIALLRLNLLDIDIEHQYDFSLNINANGIVTTIHFAFSPIYPRYTIALDLCHVQTVSSLYTDYEPFYSWLKGEQIAVYEIRNRSCFNQTFLDTFDAVLLDGFYVTNESVLSSDEIQSLTYYYNNGGAIGILPCFSQSNATLLNESINWSGISLPENMTNGIWNVTDSHSITNGLEIPSGYSNPSGSLLSHNSSFRVLAGEGDLVSGKALLTVRSDSGRILVSGFGSIFNNNKFNKNYFWTEFAKRIIWWLLEEP